MIQVRGLSTKKRTLVAVEKSDMLSVKSCSIERLTSDRDSLAAITCSLVRAETRLSAVAHVRLCSARLSPSRPMNESPHC